ncbi:MAG: hypothetical protein U0X20_17375 [Caldilineaceae bacterium]
MNSCYQIRITGHLTADWSEWFDGLNVIQLPAGETLLAGSLDQARLHGVLARIRDLNLTLVAVTRLDENLRDDTQ